VQRVPLPVHGHDSAFAAFRMGMSGSASFQRAQDCSLRQAHPAQQVGEAGIGAEMVEFRVTFKDLRPHDIPSPQDVFEKHGRSR
jgi:hypothetical protein